MFRGILFSAILAVAAANAEPNYYYFNRKAQADPETHTQQIIQEALINTPKDRWIRILDFNPNLSAAKNIVAHDQIQKPYSTLSENEREQLIFNPYIAQLVAAMRSNENFIFHLDHHYSFVTLSDTSTTVLAVDLLNSIYKKVDEGILDPTLTRHLLKKIANSVAILDHSDADIILSNFVLNHAEDRDLIQRVGPLLKATALYNDYLVDTPEINADEMRTLFYVMEGIERAIADDQLTPLESWNLVTRATEPPQKKLFAFLMDRFSRAKAMESKIQALKFILVNDYSPSFEFKRGEIYRIGDIILAYPNEAVDCSQVYSVLQKMDGEAYANAKVLLVVSQDPATQITFLKMRTFGTHFDLNKVYPHLSARGLQPGGRAQAGSAAYGKSGKKNVSDRELQRDLKIIIQSFQEVSCTESIKKIAS